MKPDQHIQLGVDYLSHAGTTHPDPHDFAVLAAAHFLAALAIRTELGQEGLALAADQTAVIPSLREHVEPWVVTNTGSDDYSAWVNERGELQWVPLDGMAQPSWRQLFVEKRSGL